MKIDILQVPYDSGHRGVRMGAGPLRLISAGLPDQLTRTGHEVRVIPVELASPAPAEIAAAFELAVTIHERVEESRERRALPLILAGNCIASLGAIAALWEPSVFWFDAHGDLNTPETTRSGFLDGMALSIALGRCWTRLSGRTGLRPLAEERVWLIGARDLDPGEHGYLAHAALHTSLDALPRVTESPAYLHIDLDVLDPRVATANQFAAPGGLSLEELLQDIGLIARAYRIEAAAVTAYDPAADEDGAAAAAALAICQHIVALAAAQEER
jgi:arginase